MQKTTTKGKLHSERKGRPDTMQLFAASLFGVLTSLFFVLGRELENVGTIQVRGSLLVMIPVFALLFGSIAYVLFRFFAARSAAEDKPAAKGPVAKLLDKYEALPAFTRRCILFAILFLAYLIVLLAVYPGFFVYDAYEELRMFRSGEFTNHHPLAHVLLLGGIVSAVQGITGSYNAGIFVYSILQIFLIASAFVYLIETLRFMEIPRALRVLSLIFMALFPTVVMFTLCTAKDGIFSAMLLIMTVELYRLLLLPERTERQIHIHRFFFVASAMLAILFRHNGLYAFLVFIPFFLFARRKRIREALVLSFVPVIAALLLGSFLTAVTTAEKGEHQEMLTVPIQQIARTYLYEPGAFTEEEKEILFTYLPEDSFRHYTPKLSDPLKIHFDNKTYDADKASFLTLWLRKGVHHPMTYINAWFLTCYGEWYPYAVIDCYKGQQVFSFTYEDGTYFGFETEEPGERHSLIPAVENLYRYFSLDSDAQRIPLFRFLFNPGGMAWIFLFTLCYLLGVKRYKQLLVLLPMLLVYLTVLLGPCSLPRYVCYLWFAFPLMAAMLFQK